MTESRLVSIGHDSSDPKTIYLYIDRGLKGGRLDRVPIDPKQALGLAISCLALIKPQIESGAP